MKLSGHELYELMTMLKYNPNTGIFKWTVNFRSANNRQHVSVGDVAGVVANNGYIRINYKSRYIMAHQLAWLIVHGRLPTKFIDHKDRDRSNNRISNLREVTKVQNGQNRTLNKNSKTGIIGVTLHPAGQFCANITVNKKSYTQYFYTIEEAAAWRAEMVDKYFDKII